MVQFPSPLAPGPLLRDMSTKMEGPGVCEEMRTARWFSTYFNPAFISSCFAYLEHRFPLGIMASATSDFRPLTFSFRFKPFASSNERNVFPPLSETLRFVERLQCFFSDVPFAHSDFSIPWSSFLFRGRRQLPQAGESAAPWLAWRAVR